MHLKLPRLGMACKKLGVDYAPAMAGFEIRGGRSVPIIQGVVVCEQDGAAVLEAHHTAEECAPAPAWPVHACPATMGRPCWAGRWKSQTHCMELGCTLQGAGAEGRAEGCC